jgi:hypothetical protein
LESWQRIPGSISTVVNCTENKRTPEYGDDTSLVPITMSLTLENRDTGGSVSFEFANDDGGGPDGTEKRTHAVDFLEAQGCN